MMNKARIEGSIFREYSSHEAAVSALLAKFPKLLTAADCCRVGTKQLSAYANPNMPERHMPIDVVSALERAAGEPVVTRHLASMQDWAMFPLPNVAGSSKWDRHLRSIVKEASEVFLELADALEDGKMSRKEAIDLLPEVDEAMSAFAGLRNSLVGQVAAGSPEAVSQQIADR